MFADCRYMFSATNLKCHNISIHNFDLPTLLFIAIGTNSMQNSIDFFWLPIFSTYFKLEKKQHSVTLTNILGHGNSNNCDCVVVEAADNAIYLDQQHGSLTLLVFVLQRTINTLSIVMFCSIPIGKSFLIYLNKRALPSSFN